MVVSQVIFQSMHIFRTIKEFLWMESELLLMIMSLS